MTLWELWEHFWNFKTFDWKGFNMMYHSTHSDNYLWYLILRGKNKKTKKKPEYKVLAHFLNGRNESENFNEAKETLRYWKIYTKKQHFYVSKKHWDLLINLLPLFLKKGRRLSSRLHAANISTNQNAKFEFTYRDLVWIFCFYLQGWRFFSRYNSGGGGRLLHRSKQWSVAI